MLCDKHIADVIHLLLKRTAGFSEEELQKMLKLEPISIVHVYTHILSTELTRRMLCATSAAALSFLSLLSLKWAKLSSGQQEQLVAALRTLKCMPTRIENELKLPHEVKISLLST